MKISSGKRRRSVTASIMDIRCDHVAGEALGGENLSIWSLLASMAEPRGNVTRYGQCYVSDRKRVSMTNVLRRTPKVAKIFQSLFRCPAPHAANLLGVRFQGVGWFFPVSASRVRGRSLDSWGHECVWIRTFPPQGLLCVSRVAEMAQLVNGGRLARE